jgi:hypothetical protein
LGAAGMGSMEKPGLVLDTRMVATLPPLDLNGRAAARLYQSPQVFGLKEHGQRRLESDQHELNNLFNDGPLKLRQTLTQVQISQLILIKPQLIRIVACRSRK